MRRHPGPATPSLPREPFEWLERLAVPIRVLLAAAVLAAGLAALVWPASAQVRPGPKVGEGPAVERKGQDFIRPIEIRLNGRPFARGHGHSTTPDPSGDARLGVDQSCISERDVVRAVGGARF